MAYPSERSFLKNVTVPRFVTGLPFQGHPSQYQAVDSPMTGTGFPDGNVPFLDHSYAMSNYEPMDDVRLQEQQLSPASRPWPSAPPNSSISIPIPPAQKKTISKNGVAVPIAATPPLDYTLLLISLAEDYFAAAHGEGSLSALVRGEGEMQAYYGLIATGLGCLEAVLKVGLPAVRHFNGANLNMRSISDYSPGWRR